MLLEGTFLGNKEFTQWKRNHTTLSEEAEKYSRKNCNDWEWDAKCNRLSIQKGVVYCQYSKKSWLWTKSVKNRGNVTPSKAAFAKQLQMKHVIAEITTMGILLLIQDDFDITVLISAADSSVYMTELDAESGPSDNEVSSDTEDV